MSNLNPLTPGDNKQVTYSKVFLSMCELLATTRLKVLTTSIYFWPWIRISCNWSCRRILWNFNNEIQIEADIL